MSGDVDQIREAVERRRLSLGTSDPLAMWGLSALVRGAWTPVETSLVEAPALDHATVAMRATAALETFANAGVSAINDEMVGPIMLQLEVRFADASTAGRGTHAGVLEWGPPDRIVLAAVEGMTNTIAWSPTDAPQPPDARGMLAGQMRGTFEHEILGRCQVDAAYLLQVADYTEEGAAVVGSIEGVVSTADNLAAR